MKYWRNMSKDRILKSVFGLATAISLSVDLVTVGLLLKNLYNGVVPLNIESALPWLFIIILIPLKSTPIDVLIYFNPFIGSFNGEGGREEGGRYVRSIPYKIHSCYDTCA